MPDAYRSPDTAYRDANTPYRGSPESLPIDMQRQDDIAVYLVDKYGNIINELPAAFVNSVEWGLMSLGEIPTASMGFSAYDPSALAIALGEQEVQIRFNDVVLADGQPLTWWGMMGGDSATPGAYGLDLDSIEAWLGVRPVEAATLVFGGEVCEAPVEQFDIGWGLVNMAQTGANMDLNFTASYQPSGINRCLIAERDQHPYYIDILKDFSEAERGFDWEIVPHADGRRVWTPYYPQKGVHRQDISFVYDTSVDYGNNVFHYSRQRDVKNLATRAYATGGNSGVVKFEQSYEDVAASERYGVRVAVVADASQKDLVWLGDKAKQTVKQRNHPQMVLELTVKNHPEVNPETNIDPGPLLGILSTGDWYQVVVNDGVTQVDDELRLGTIRWNADDTLTLGFLIPVVR